MTIALDNPAAVAAAGKAAVRIRQFYQIEELYGRLFTAQAEAASIRKKLVEARITAEFAESAVKDREDELLEAATGKSETERKANYSQAKRNDEELRALRADYQFAITAKYNLEADLTAAEMTCVAITTTAALTAAELSAIGAYAATKEDDNG